MVIMPIVKLLPNLLLMITAVCSIMQVQSANDHSQAGSLLNLLNGAFDPNIAKLLEREFIGFPEKAGSYLKRAIKKNNVEAVKWIIEYIDQEKGVFERSSAIFRADSIIDYILQAIGFGYLLGHEEVTKILIEWKLKKHNDSAMGMYKDQLEIMEKIFSKNPLDINVKGSNGNTLLHIACKQNQLKIVKILLSNTKVDINIQNERGNSAILEAMENGHLDIAQALLSRQDLDVNVKNNCGDTLLHITCYKNQLDILRGLLDRDIQWLEKVVGGVPSNQNTAFDKAQFNNILNVNAQNNLGWTAIHCACSVGNLKLVELLLKITGLNVNIKSGDSHAPILRASYWGYWDIVQALFSIQDLDINIQNSDENTLLHIACRMNRLEIVKCLLTDPNININLQNKWGNTAIITAMFKGHLEIVKILLFRKDLDVNIKNMEGDTLLHVACRKSRLKVVKWLILEPKVNVNIQNNSGHTAIMEAAHNGYLSIAHALLDRKELDMNVRNHCGDTLLHIACYKNQVEIVKKLLTRYKELIPALTKTVVGMLLEQNASYDKAFPHITFDLNCKNNSGSTPFHSAGNFGNPNLIALLLDAPNIGVNLENFDGDTLLDIVCRKNCWEAAEILLADPRVDKSHRNKYGNTAKSEAVLKSSAESAKVFNMF